MTPAAEPDPTVAGVILAGGASRRMGGGDKSLALLCGRSLAAHVVGRLTPQIGRLALNANGDPARFAGLGLPIVADAGPELAGPLAGFLAGMTWAAGDAATRAIVTTPADTPFIPRDLVARLRVAVPDDGTIAVARSRGALHPVVALLPLALREDLAAWLGRTSDRAVRTWLARHRWVAVDFADDAAGADPFFNVNTPEDLSLAAEIAGRDADLA